MLQPQSWRWGSRQRGAPHPGSLEAAHLLVLVTLLTAYALFPSSDLFRSPPISLHSPSAFFEHQAEITDSWTPTEHSPGLTITTTGPRDHPPGKAEPARRPPRRSLQSPPPRHEVPRSVPPLPPDYYPIFHSSEEDLLQQEHPPAAGPRDLAPADHPPVKAPLRAPRRSAASPVSALRHTPTRSAAPPLPSPLPRQVASAHG